MKLLKYVTTALIVFFLFEACQKEFSLESGISGDQATGSLKDTLGNCLPVISHGNYIFDSTLTDSNFVVIQVNFSTPGNYNISTDTKNGFSFQGSGATKDSGLQNIILKGTGKPISPQQTIFSVSFDSSVCSFSISVTGDSITGTKAVYTLAGSPNTCSNSIVAGTYEEGTPLNSSNTVSLYVDVTSTGNFSMSTTAVNGMTFVFPQGEFTKTGPQLVILQGLGTPDSAGTFTVPITAGGTSCSFNVTVNSFRPPGIDSAWQFSSGTNFYYGFIDSARKHDVPNLGTALSFYGFSYSGKDTLFQVDILLPDKEIQTGTFNTDSANADFYLFSPDTTIAPFYHADFTVTPPVNIEIKILSYDQATGIITGIFSGTAVNSSDQKVSVTGGKIYAKVD